MQIRHMETLIGGEIVTLDLAEYADSVGDLWDLDFVQLEACSDEIRCRYVTDGDAILYEEHFGAASLQRGCLNGCRIVLALPDPMARSGRWQGGSCPDSSLAYARGGEPLDLLIPALSTIRVAILPLERFTRRLGLLTGMDPERVLPRGRMFVQLTPLALAGLWSSWGRIIQKGGVLPGGGLGDLVAEQVATSLRSGAEPAGTDFRAAWSNFRRITRHIEAGGVPTSPGELAAELGMSLRSVHDACQRCVGLPPGRFLRLQRMNRVRQVLVQFEPGDRTVTSIAIDEGFTELGRFAGEYRRLFNELPSETLRSRRPAGMTVRIGRASQDGPG